MRYMMFVGTDPEGEPLEEDTAEAWVTDVDGRASG